jgi:hypothetical protein
MEARKLKEGSRRKKIERNTLKEISGRKEDEGRKLKAFFALHSRCKMHVYVCR